MKTVLPRNSKRFAFARIVLVVLAVLFVLTFGKGVVARIAAEVLSPLYSLAYYFEHSSATVPVFFRDRDALIETQRNLEARIAAQQGSELTLAQTLKENDELRALLGNTREKQIVAGVTGYPPYTPYDTLILDHGSDVGIQVYAPVFLGAGRAIGYVRSVTQNGALVTLFSSPGVETTVYMYGPNIFAHAHGVGGGVVRIDVPQGIALTKGDVVILPSLDSGTLGTVDAIESTPTSPEQHAFVTLAAPVSSMHMVAIGTKPLTPVDFKTATLRVDEFAKTLLTFPIPEAVPSASSTTASSSTPPHATTTSL